MAMIYNLADIELINDMIAEKVHFDDLIAEYYDNYRLSLMRKRSLLK